MISKYYVAYLYIIYDIFVILSGGAPLLRNGVEGPAVRPQRKDVDSARAPGLATFETRVRKDSSLWESRQIQKLQFLYIP